MDAIFTDSYLDTRIKICVLLNVIVPKLEDAGGVWEGSWRVVKQAGNSADDTNFRRTRMLKYDEEYRIMSGTGNVPT